MAGINSPAHKYTPSISSPAGGSGSSFADSLRQSMAQGPPGDASPATSALGRSNSNDSAASPAQRTTPGPRMQPVVQMLQHAVSTPMPGSRPAPIAIASAAAPLPASTPRGPPGYTPVASPLTPMAAPNSAATTGQASVLTKLPLNSDGTPMQPLPPRPAVGSPHPSLRPVPRGLVPVQSASPRIIPRNLTPVAAPGATGVGKLTPVVLAQVSQPVKIPVETAPLMAINTKSENRVPFGGSPPKPTQQFSPPQARGADKGFALSPRDQGDDMSSSSPAAGPPQKKKMSISSLFREVAVSEEPTFADSDTTPSAPTALTSEASSPSPKLINNEFEVPTTPEDKSPMKGSSADRQTSFKTETLDEKIERLSKDVTKPVRRNSERSLDAGRPPPSPKIPQPEDMAVKIAGVPVRRPSIGFLDARASSPNPSEGGRPAISSAASKHEEPPPGASSSPVHDSVSKFSPSRPGTIVVSPKLQSSKTLSSPAHSNHSSHSGGAASRNKDDDDIVSRADTSVASRNSKKVGGTITVPPGTKTVSSQGHTHDRWKPNDTELIKDGDFSMRTRNTNSSGNKSVNVNKGHYATRGKGTVQDPTQYSFDNWSLSRQMRADDDISSVGIRSEAGGVHLHGGEIDDALVKVITRVRPFSVGEVNSGCRRVVSVNGDKVILVNPNAFDAEPDTISAVAAAASLEKMRCNDWAKVFRFDNCLWSFDSMNMHDDAYADQLSTHEEVGHHLVRDMLRGIPVTCFAYGHTGTGKTYTMFGPEISGDVIDNLNESNLILPQEAGLIPRVFADIIRGVYPPEADVDYESDTRITISFLEIYQERIKDLLNADDDMNDLRIREHPSLGPYVENLTKIEVRSPIEMLQILQAGTSERKVASNNRNSASSRSHVVVTLEMTPVDAPPAPYAMKTPIKGNGSSSGYGNYAQKEVPYEFIRCQMIDLAGSEKEYKEELGTSGGIAKWKTPKSRDESNLERVELKMIRKSLSTLGYIIRALAQGLSVKGMPFRDSSLTWILKDSLSGNCSLTMVSTVSPSDSCYEETLNTLKYAERLCAIGSGSGNPGMKRGAVSINDTIDPQLTFALASEFRRLKEELGGANGTRAARQLLKQTVSDPQQRLAKLAKEEANTGTATKRRVSGTATTPDHNNTSLLVAAVNNIATPAESGSIVPATPLTVMESNSLSQLRETYRQLHGRFIELQIELENARTDRDGLNLEMQSLRDALAAAKNGTSTKHQNRLFQAPATDMSAALLAAEDEIAELKSAIQRKEESSDRMLNELAAERQIRNTIERTAKAQVVDLISRVESLHKYALKHIISLYHSLTFNVFRQTAAAKEEAESCQSEAIAAIRAKEDAESMVSALKSEILRSREEINMQTINLESVIDSLRRQVNDLIKERELLDPRAKEAQREKDEMLVKMQSMVSRIGELNGKLEDCYKQLGRTESDLKEAAKEKANWMDRENAWVKRVQEMQSTLERVERDKSTLLGREGSLSKQVLDMEIAMAGGEAKYKSLLEALSLERDSLVEIVKQQGQALHVQQQQADASLKMLYQRQGALERIENQTIDAKAMEDLSRLQDELHGLFSREGKTLQSELHDAKQLMVIVASLKDKLADMDMLREELQYEQKERRRLENKLADLIEDAAAKGKEKRDQAIVDATVRASSTASIEAHEIKEQVEHYKKIAAGWESRSHYWQQIAKKQISGVGGNGGNIDVNGSSSTPDLHPVHLKFENDRLTKQLTEAQEEATAAKNELIASKEDMQKEFTSLWLAVQKLNTIDAEKEKAIQDIVAERDNAIREKNDAIEKLRVLEKEYEELQGELEVGCNFSIFFFFSHDTEYESGN